MSMLGTETSSQPDSVTRSFAAASATTANIAGSRFNSVIAGCSRSYRRQPEKLGCRYLIVLVVVGSVRLYNSSANRVNRGVAPIRLGELYSSSDERKQLN